MTPQDVQKLGSLASWLRSVEAREWMPGREMAAQSARDYAELVERLIAQNPSENRPCEAS